MSFLDHFRRKLPEPEETSAKTAAVHNEVDKKIGEVAYKPAFKNEAPQPPARCDTAGEEKSCASPGPNKPVEVDTSIYFSLGDFLHRIPRQLLKPGPHESSFEMRFDAADVADRIARGNTTISLVEVYKRAPHIFCNEIHDSDNINIRFPWQKLMHLVRPEIAAARKEGFTHAVAESLAAQVRRGKRAAAAAGGGRANAPCAGTQPSSSSEAVELGSTTPPNAAPQIGPPQTPPAREIDLAASNARATPAPMIKPQIAASPVPLPSAMPSSASSSAGEGPPESQLAFHLAGEHPPAANAITAERGVLDVTPPHRAERPGSVGEHQAPADQRDEPIAQVKEAAVEIDEKTSQAELEKTLVARSTENVAEGHHATLQATVHAQANELENFKKQIEELKNDGKLEEIVRQRDALLQQKNHLSDQLAQVRHQRGAPNSEPASVPRAGQVERSKREYQRQIEELQRRIAAFENSQKEAAHELGKEREARIKVERALAAAERTRAEATALVENTRNETRRELETTLRKREAEFARAQQEMQEQIDSLTQAKRDAAAGHEQLLARAAEEESKTRTEREQLHARIAELDQATAAAGASNRQPTSTGWESRAVASLEADIESYRTRIKALLQERDDWTKEREKLAAASSLPGSEAALRELTAANEKLSAEFARATSERDQLVEQVRASEQHLRQAEHAQSRLDTVIKARDDADGELTRVKAVLVQIAADHQLDLAGVQEKYDVLAREKSDVERELEKIKLGQGELRLELEQRLAAALRENKTLAARLESFTKSTREATQSSQRQQDYFAPMRDVLERDVAPVKTEYVRALAAACAERDEARARVIELETRFAAETAALARERDETRREGAALAERIAALERETGRTVSDLRDQCEALASERRATLAELKMRQEAHEAERDALARERESAVRERDEALASAERTRIEGREEAFVLHREPTGLQQLEPEVTGRFDHEIARLRRERDTLLRQRDELRERLSRMVTDQRDLPEQITEPSQSALEPVELIPARRDASESNIIDITADTDAIVDSEANIDLPRVRPVSIPPPQIRVL